jgi:hypothetical protein
VQPSPGDCCTLMVWVARGQCAGPSGAGSLRNVLRCPLSRGCFQSRAGEHPRLPGRGGGKHAPQWHGLAPPRPRARWRGEPPWATRRPKVFFLCGFLTLGLLDGAPLLYCSRPRAIRRPSSSHSKSEPSLYLTKARLNQDRLGLLQVIREVADHGAIRRPPILLRNLIN